MSSKRHLSNKDISRESEPQKSNYTSCNHLPRLFVDAPTLAEGVPIPLSPAQSNYLHVMRIDNVKRWGQWAGCLRIFNGRDGEWLAKKIVSDGSATSTDPSTTTRKQQQQQQRRRRATGDSTVIECCRELRRQPDQPVPEIVLHLGRLKKTRRKWSLEKVTELGTSSIRILTDTEFSASDPWETEKHYLQVVEAAEQCERLTLPNVITETWEDLVQQLQSNLTNERNSMEQWLVCRERSDSCVPILHAIQPVNNSNECMHRTIHILVGPEGGWSPKELNSFDQFAKEGALQCVSLGSLVLRAETAAIAAVTAVSMVRGL